MSERDRRFAALLFVIISSVYFGTAAGITSSNDGSHYALVRALVDKHSFEISEYLDFTENQDYALNGDLKFSDRPPGTAILSAPVYALSTILPKPLVTIHSKHDPDNPRLIYAMAVPVAAASATAILLFWILRVHFGQPEWVAVVTTVAFAFGTMTWKYGSLLYSHATSGLAVMGVVTLMLHYRPHASTAPRGGAAVDTYRMFWLGLLLGVSVLMEYTNIVFVVLAGVWWVSMVLRPSPQPSPRPSRQGWQLFAFIVGGLLPGLFLMWYNTLNFGGPFRLSTFHADTSRWPQNASFLADFATPIWVGLPAMLFYGHDNQGLFWLAPITLLGLFGLKGVWRRSRREFTLILGVFLAMLMLFSTSTTFNPYTNDGRYLTPFLGLWFVAVGFGVARTLTPLPSPSKAEGSQAVPFRSGEERVGVRGESIRLAVVYGLLFFSIRNQIMHIAFSWGHDLSLAALRPWAASPDNIVALWRAVFPNAVNVPLWGGMLAVGGMVWWVRQQRIKRVQRIESA